MTIGNEPLIDTLVLVKGQDFIHEILMPAGESVPPSTTCELIISDLTGAVLADWDASVASTSISWNVSSTVADTINLPATFRIYVHYSDGKDFCWYAGQVVRE
ncbi:LtfC-like domain-containing protein [Nocardia xishanensis]|uniref:LtfC-like domain-containing protein n=1 Tax=Nocardia xishanensis TaxID=238964 RepID=UPI000831C0BE|nr:hypothetical protein [Nocardia xishanensis]